MIIKHEIPILEYDDHSAEVIAPAYEWNNEALPKKCLFAFLGDIVENYANLKLIMYTSGLLNCLTVLSFCLYCI